MFNFVHVHDALRSLSPTVLFCFPPIPVNIPSFLPVPFSHSCLLVLLCDSLNLTREVYVSMVLKLLEAGGSSWG